MNYKKLFDFEFRDSLPIIIEVVSRSIVCQEEKVRPDTGLPSEWPGSWVSHPTAVRSPGGRCPVGLLPIDEDVLIAFKVNGNACCPLPWSSR